MAAQDDQKLIRVVKIVLDLIFGLLVIVSIILVVWSALTPIILNTTDIKITASVPVSIGTGDLPTFELEVMDTQISGSLNAFVDEGQGTLRLETTDWKIILISNLAKILTAIGLAYLIYLIRAVIEALLKGDRFSAKNTFLIRRIGYLVLGVGLLKAAVEYLASTQILNRLAMTHPVLGPPSPFQAELILASLLILVLAQVWSYGVELERDQVLTI